MSYRADLKQLSRKPSSFTCIMIPTNGILAERNFRQIREQSQRTAKRAAQITFTHAQLTQANILDTHI
jgi:hypothetical protein